MVQTRRFLQMIPLADYRAETLPPPYPRQGGKPDLVLCRRRPAPARSPRSVL
jgi:hypothetical protein